MSVTIFPLSTDDQLSLQLTADKSSIASETAANTVPQQQRPKSLDQYPLLLTIPEIAEILGVGRSTAYSLIHSGQIKSIRVGRLIKVPKTALEQFIHSF